MYASLVPHQKSVILIKHSSETFFVAGEDALSPSGKLTSVKCLIGVILECSWLLSLNCVDELFLDVVGCSLAAMAVNDCKCSIAALTVHIL